MTFLALYVFGKVGVTEYITVVFNAFLMMVAVWVAITRTADYEHHATDVIAGGILGLVLGVVVYRLFYPSVFNKDFASRAWPTWLQATRIEPKQTSSTSSDNVEMFPKSRDSPDRETAPFTAAPSGLDINV